MKISVFGLGYVGAVCAACFADNGKKVIAVEPNSLKVDLVNNGHAPIIEAGLEGIIQRSIKAGVLTATSDVAKAIEESNISFICVGTPSLTNGNLDCIYLENVCKDIGTELAKKDDFHVVVIRSTILPGTMNRIIIPTLERESGKRAGIDFGVCNNPEFLREGSAVYDFNNPEKTVIGATDERSGDIVQELYRDFPGTFVRCGIEIGEISKYADNLWHALKVAYANEIGKLCKALNMDSHQVMDIMCLDTRLNISSSYLRPGFAFGGSCLPKDIRALVYKARSMDVSLPLLESLLPSNYQLVEQGLEMVFATKKKRIGLLGFSFKAGTDDLRESPLVEVIERLIGKGYELKIYDRNVNLAKLTGANRDYILKAIPHIEKLMTDRLSTVFDHAEVIIIGNNAPEFSRITQYLQPEQIVIDFVRVKEIEDAHANYHGISW